MKVTLLTHGTRGDLQPHLNVAHELRVRGHAVVVAANSNNLGVVHRAGLESYEIPVDTRELLESPKMQRLLLSGRSSQFGREIARFEAVHGPAMDAAMIEAARDADVLVTGPLTAMSALSIAEAGDQALVGCFPYPVERTREFPSPFVVERQLTSPMLCLATYAAVDLVWQYMNRGATRRIRRTLGLRGRVSSPFARIRDQRIPVELMVSPVLLPKPGDWQDNYAVAGAPFLSPEQRLAWGEGAIDPELDAWLDEGEPPVYFSFGSLPVLDRAACLEMIGTVARRSGVRALVGAGWSDFRPGVNADRSMLVTGAFDYDRVLPRCRAAIHHGGAGTTHDVARAGIPAVITHVFPDHILWGWRLAALGIGSAVPYRKVNADLLIEALAPVLSSAAAQRARAVGEAMSRERGASQVCDTIERQAAA
ncbi:glycosyltransferase [Nocardia sp. SYP-A9097]|uniref:glycosyltransferase n=1 Tax=Nocardia sp. SYP-A9097 TaxID=2663237 RepID=UPI0018912E91|nr:glycosyltransferase [Nocardia sp. SYP-A9097]